MEYWIAMNLAGDYDDAIAALTGIKKIIKEETPPIVDEASPE